MPVIRNLVVVSAKVSQKAFTALEKNGLEPMGVIEAPTATLFFVVARINVDSILAKAKIPQKEFRILWIDDESDFARTGRLVDPCFETRFEEHVMLIIRKADLELLKVEQAKDHFLSLGGKRNAKNYDAAFSGFLADCEPENEENGWLHYRLENPILTSYEEPEKWQWLSMNVDANDIDEIWRCPKLKHRTSIGSFFAVDVNSWWQFNQKGIVNIPQDEDLSADIFATFRYGERTGCISSSDSTLDGCSLED